MLSAAVVIGALRVNIEIKSLDGLEISSYSIYPVSAYRILRSW